MTSWPLARLLPLLCAVCVASACDPNAGATGVNLTVSFAPAVQFDQVEIAFAVEGAEALRSVRAPDPAAPLNAAGSLIVILLPDALADTDVVLTVDGLHDGQVGASGDVTVHVVGGARTAASVHLGEVLRCGDGALRVGRETCDDNNASAGDGCGADCIVESGYTCAGAPSVCTPTNASCGDGFVTTDERCDDHNTNSGDGCTDLCAVEIGYACVGEPSVCVASCGNGVTDVGEQCDDGNLVTRDGCNGMCVVEQGFFCAGEPSACIPVCGDGLLRGSEACDDGGGAAADGCSPTCHVEAGYACTDEPSTCVQSCGDGALDPGELCDDNNTAPDDGCGASCTIEAGYACAGEPSLCVQSCGNGVLDIGEQCDDSNAIAADGCTQSCGIELGYACPSEGAACVPICPDGTVLAGEACDDGNANSGDGCDAQCDVEAGYACVGSPSQCAATCGDGSPSPGEGCDDRGTANGDGCSATCVVEAGFSCVGSPSACFQTCGNGSLDAGETCDDRNTAGSDGCTNTCQREVGFLCTPVGSACTPVCGDGLIRGAEQCDDSNTASTDGCSATCALEAGFNCSGAPSVCVRGCHIGGVPVSEGALDPQNACRACRSAINATAYSNVVNGSSCSDGQFCDGNETCTAGECLSSLPPCGGTTPICDDVADVCRCSGGSCADGAFCNGNETCLGSGACAAGTPPGCAAPAALCSETLDQCVECESDADCADPTPSCVAQRCLACPTCTGCDPGEHDGGDGSCVPEGTCVGGYALAYTDGDRDGVGAGALSADCFALPLAAGLSSEGTDCDDGDAAKFVLQDLYFDDDLDGYTLATPNADCVGDTLPNTRKVAVLPPPVVGFEPLTAVNAGNGQSWSKTFGVAHTGRDVATTQLNVTGENTKQLRVSGYGLTVDAAAIIKGVRVHVWRRGSSSTRRFRDRTVQLMVNGAPTGTNHADTATNWPTSLGEAVYGGPTDTWGAALTPAVVNAAGFGVAIDATLQAADDTDAELDAITVEVFVDQGGDCNDGNASVWTSTTGVSDADGDNYAGLGLGTGPQCVGAAMPAGISQHSAGNDCFDGNYSARPLQTSFFSTSRGDGSFDYDCDGDEVRQAISQDTGCMCTGFCASSGSASYTPTQACGTQVDDDRCSGSCASATCALDTTTTTTNRCH